ncbi:DUF397 domain-containing protein [Micromonospora fluostatini]|uniref:DUF397 domain-containing protein n=1 Tax=Micromonospora fluostatini TaxID=1629071 RepID=A0ABY2DH75_9ACTN|nr:DUF397 domain-containing protein [Micromonospora fluostatini]
MTAVPGRGGARVSARPGASGASRRTGGTGPPGRQPARPAAAGRPPPRATARRGTPPESVSVRDSKDRSGPVLTFTETAWRGFVNTVARRH